MQPRNPDPVVPQPGRSSACSWSGGKDSCLALWRARQCGHSFTTLLTMLEESGEKSRSHGLPPSLLARQAAAMGLSWRGSKTSWTDYEQRFIAELRVLQAAGTDTIVFGDIDLQPHRDWEEKVCAAAGLRAELPLWGENRLALVEELWSAGFKALVVCTDARFLGAEFCGREFDRDFLADLPAGVDACGEQGEFHTFVYDGPLFRAPVPFATMGFIDYVAPAQFGGAAYRIAELAPRN